MKQSRETCLFSVGQLVRLKTGKSPQEVIEITERNYGRCFLGWNLACRYLSSSPDYLDYVRRPRDQHDFELFNQTWIPERSPFDQPKETMMSDLYQVRMQDDNETPRFGTKLTENSQGQFVLEMKGEGGKVEAFNPTDLELVVPYTVQLVCVPPNESGMHIQAEPGKLNKDDLLIQTSNGKMFRVAAVDTKNRCPKTGSMTFFKLSGENVTVGNDN